MQKSATVKQQLHNPRVSLLRCNMKRRQSLSVRFIYYESAFFGVEQLFNRVVSAVPCGKVQRRFIVVVLQVNARSHANKILQRANMPFAWRVMQRRAASVVFFIQKINPAALSGAANFLGELFQATSINDNEVQKVSLCNVFEMEVCSVFYESMNRSPASTWCRKKNGWTALFVCCKRENILKFLNQKKFNYPKRSYQLLG